MWGKSAKYRKPCAQVKHKGKNNSNGINTMTITADQHFFPSWLSLKIT